MISIAKKSSIVKLFFSIINIPRVANILKDDIKSSEIFFILEINILKNNH